MTRADHLAWCKTRALEYVERGDLDDAFQSLLSDLGKHPETIAAQDMCGDLGMNLLLGGHLNTLHEMRKWIEGFN